MQMQLSIIFVKRLDRDETVKAIKFCGNNFITSLWAPDYKDCMLQRQQLGI